MSDIFEKLTDGIQQLFPELDDMEITLETELGEIPEWDSMSAVNLQSFLEQEFRVSIPQDLLNEETTVKEVISFVENPESMELEAV